MSIFAALTGSASKKAAQQNAALIGQGLTAGADALTTGANNAITTLGTRDAGTALSALGQGYGQARTDLGGQYGQTQGYLGQLGQQYSPLIQQGGNAYNAYSDAIGANGAAGSDRAQAAFRAGPGYEFQRDQALEAIQRSAAARGGLAGGNATRDLLATATGLADASFQNYITNLKGGTDLYTQGLAGRGQALQGQATASQNQGSALAALGTGYGTNAANTFTNAAGIQSGLGQGVANLWGNATNALVQNNNNRAAAQTQASNNLLGGVLGLANSGLKALGNFNPFFG